MFFLWVCSTELASCLKVMFISWCAFFFLLLDRCVLKRLHSSLIQNNNAENIYFSPLVQCSFIICASSLKNKANQVLALGLIQVVRLFSPVLLKHSRQERFAWLLNWTRTLIWSLGIQHSEAWYCPVFPGMALRLAWADGSLSASVSLSHTHTHTLFPPRAKHWQPEVSGDTHT